MKINRWIFIPLLFALTFGFYFGFLHRDFLLENFLIGFVGGTIGGLIVQTISEIRIKKFSRNKAPADFSVQQNRDFTLLLNYRTAFELCIYCILSLKAASIEFENEEAGIVVAKTKWNFHSFGTSITFQIQQLSENLMEVKILTHPKVRTTIVDYGESLKVIEEISHLLTEKYTEIRSKNLVDKAGTSEEFQLKYITRREIDYK